MSRHDLAILFLTIAALGVIAIVGLFLAGVKSAQDYPTEELPELPGDGHIGLAAESTHKAYGPPTTWIEFNPEITAKFDPEITATQPFGEHTEMSIEQALRIVRGDEGRGGTPHAGGRA